VTQKRDHGPELLLTKLSGTGVWPGLGAR
jgi:hypothetical protein